MPLRQFLSDGLGGRYRLTCITVDVPMDDELDQIR